MDCKYNYFLGLLFAVAVGGYFVPNKLIFMIQISSDTSIDFQYQPPSPSFKMSMKTAAKFQFWGRKCKKSVTRILVYVGDMLIKLISKHQESAATSTFSSEFLHFPDVY